MGKVLEFPTSAAIRYRRSEDFSAKAQELSDFVAGLPISAADNERLVALMVEQTNIAEHDAMLQGFEMAVKLMAEK